MSIFAIPPRAVISPSWPSMRRQSPAALDKASEALRCPIPWPACRRAFSAPPKLRDSSGLSGRTLEKHRTYGTGPKYRKIGGRVVYALDDLQAWADLGAKSSTSIPVLEPSFPPSAMPQSPWPYAGRPRR